MTPDEDFFHAGRNGAPCGNLAACRFSSLLHPLRRPMLHQHLEVVRCLLQIDRADPALVHRLAEMVGDVQQQDVMPLWAHVLDGVEELLLGHGCKKRSIPAKSSGDGPSGVFWLREGSDDGEGAADRVVLDAGGGFVLRCERGTSAVG